MERTEFIGRQPHPVLQLVAGPRQEGLTIGKVGRNDPDEVFDQALVEGGQEKVATVDLRMFQFTRLRDPEVAGVEMGIDVDAGGPRHPQLLPELECAFVVVHQLQRYGHEIFSQTREKGASRLLFPELVRL
jgi:hypothetical protein